MFFPIVSGGEWSETNKVHAEDFDQNSEKNKTKCLPFISARLSEPFLLSFLPKLGGVTDTIPWLGLDSRAPSFFDMSKGDVQEICDLVVGFVENALDGANARYGEKWTVVSVVVTDVVVVVCFRRESHSRKR